jgi:hypothetical protein
MKGLSADMVMVWISVAEYWSPLRDTVMEGSEADINGISP